MNKPVYTVSRCRDDGTFYGPVHSSRDCDITLCGKNVDDRWWVVSNSGELDTVTCKQCLIKIVSTIL